ncbi:MAG: glycosyltransferase family 39 protein [Bacteroidetes bacterium]|nr:glycosyltransferase family 39 protein [Bacteroidota bacterium]
MLDKFFSNNSQKITNRLWLYFFIIVLVNILFKIIQLGLSSFWYDEIVSVESASLDFGHIKHVSEWDNNPPFYYYCLSVWIKLFNDSEFCVRLLSVIFSSLSAGVIFLLANKFFNKITAIVVSFLYLSSNFLYFYSHEARAYTLISLLVLVSSYLFLNFRENNSWKHLIFLGIINFLITYTHYIAGLVVVFEVLLMLFYFDKKQKIKFSYSILLSILLIFLRFTKKQFLLIFAFNSPESTFWLKKSEFSYLQEVLSEFFFDYYLIIPLLLVIASGLLLSYKYKNKESNFATIYSIIVGLGSIVIVYVVGIKVSIFLDRYLIFAVPFIYILVAYAFSFIKNKYIGIIFSILFFIYFSFKIDYDTPKPMDYKNAVGFIKHVTTTEDLIIVKFNAVPSLFCYYYEKDYLKLQKKKLTNAPSVLICKSWADIGVDLTKYKRVIVVDAFEDLNPEDTEFKTNLSKQKSSNSVVSFYKGVKITFYQ